MLFCELKILPVRSVEIAGCPGNRRRELLTEAAVVVVVDHVRDQHPAIGQGLPVLGDLSSGYSPRHVVHRSVSRLRFGVFGVGAGDSRERWRRLRVPKIGQMAPVASVKKEVLSPVEHWESFDQGKSKLPADKLCRAVHIRAHQHHVVQPLQLQLGCQGGGAVGSAQVFQAQGRGDLSWGDPHELLRHQPIADCSCDCGQYLGLAEEIVGRVLRFVVLLAIVPYGTVHALGVGWEGQMILGVMEHEGRHRRVWKAGQGISPRQIHRPLGEPGPDVGITGEPRRGVVFLGELLEGRRLALVVVQIRIQSRDIRLSTVDSEAKISLTLLPPRSLLIQLLHSLLRPRCNPTISGKLCCSVCLHKFR
mmetsp:Transcript_11262/g.26936  ORF Transcript_11262/g.26936 Transcript_11262/m.26936 type:complete len:363 (-) Transcript_11262:721-1809(-)